VQRNGGSIAGNTVTLRKVIIGGTLNVLNGISCTPAEKSENPWSRPKHECYASCQSFSYRDYRGNIRRRISTVKNTNIKFMHYMDIVSRLHKMLMLIIMSVG
jgi:hypothetical protein